MYSLTQPLAGRLKPTIVLECINLKVLLFTCTEKFFLYSNFFSIYCFCMYCTSNLFLNNAILP